MTGGPDLDELTGLSRAGTFQARLDRRVAAFRASPDTDLGFSVAIVDVRRLREINAGRGRPFGDAVLIELGRRLAAGDQVDLASRVGGDEFAVLGETVTPEETSDWVRGLRRLAYEPPFEVEGVELEVIVRVVPGWVPPDRDEDLLWTVARFLEANKRVLLEQELESMRQNFATMRDGLLPAIEARTMLERFRRLAERDAPTGLLNRRGVDARLASTGSPLAVAFVDVDDRRKLNRLPDNWESGDLAILGIADRLRLAFGVDNTARWAGDEFLVLSWDEDCAATAARLKTVLKECRGTHVVAGRTVTFSGGVASCDGDVVAARRAAERAVKRAKRKKNRIRLAR